MGFFVACSGAAWGQEEPPSGWTLDSFHWTGPLAPAVGVRVLNPYGDVRLRATEDAEVEVSAMIQRWTSDPAAAQVRIRRRGDRLVIAVVYPAGARARLRRVDLTVFVPAAASVVVRAPNGRTIRSQEESEGGDGSTAGATALRGAEPLAASVPTVFRGDLRGLRRAPAWQPGDPVKEIPRRDERPPRIVPPEPEPLVDSLLEVQERVPVRSLDAPLLNFAGQSFAGATPPDPVGDVGRDYYIQAVNAASGAMFTVYNKADGSVAAGPIQLDSLGTGACASGLGDPIVLYDQLADRWLLGEIATAGNTLCVYISRTSNPITGGWYGYQFSSPSFPDYPKFGVWPDAYYASTNEASPAAYAFDRTQMLAGGVASAQRFTAPDLAAFGFQALIPGDADGAVPPPAGAPNPFMRHRDDEAHNPGANDPAKDFLEVWEFHADFANPANATLTGPITIPIAEFDSSLCGLLHFVCFPQPGSSTTLDPLREIIMHRLQYRNFGTHQSLVGNFVTDVDGTDHGGIRWFELRNSGGGWSLYQEGTFAPDAHHRWMGSAAMDSGGNLAIGYSISSSTLAPGIRYAGRQAADPPGTLQGEVPVIAGSASSASSRWGDYAALTVDPVDDRTFWLTAEYAPSSAWGTRIAAFRLCQPPGAPGIVSATAAASNRIDVLWADGSPGAASFNVDRAEGTCAAHGPFVRIAAGVPGFTYQDGTVSGGTTYAYRVTGNGTCESDPSGCVEATATGACTLAPAFAGLQTVTNPGASTCALRLSWPAATPRCGSTVSYNVYRGTTTDFVPALANRIASGLQGTAFYDPGPLVNGQTYTYAVRAVDASTGAEDTNTVRISGAPTGPSGPSSLTETFEGASSGGGFDNPGWSHAPLKGTADWVWTTDWAQSPAHSWFSQSQPSSSARALVSPDFNVAPGTALSFWHVYGFEGAPSICYDGGTLEISINGGASWSVLPDAAFTAGGFTGTVSNSSSNPIGGKRAWCAGNGLAAQVVADLSTYAGKTVRLRWQEGDDSIVAAMGWYIDSVTVAPVAVPSVCSSEPPPPLAFYTVPPCRLVDTRSDVPALQPSASRTFVLTGACGVPAAAKALSVNLTVTQPTAAGHLTLHPAGIFAPQVSSINFSAGQTRANNAIVVLSSDGTGRLTVANGAAGSVHFILDVNGYFQ